MNLNIKTLILLFPVIVLVACSGGSGGGSPSVLDSGGSSGVIDNGGGSGVIDNGDSIESSPIEEMPSSTPTPASAMPIAVEFINGNVEKGPFILDSNVFIQELNDQLKPTGKTYITRTIDDLGSFILETPPTTNFVDINSQGFFFNEVSGELSEAELSLSTISENAIDINVNILTTLSRERLKYLIKNDKETYDAARKKAEGEVLNVFHIARSDIAEEGGGKKFDKMTITQRGDSNAVLLAASLELMGFSSTGQISEMTGKITNDLKTDGRLDSKLYKEKIRQNGMLISPQIIRDNLAERYIELESEELIPQIPKFEDFLDSDGDGIINKNDLDYSIMARALPAIPKSRLENQAPWQARYGHAMVEFKDKMWILGGAYYLNGKETLLNDIWNSADGIHWARVEGEKPQRQCWTETQRDCKEPEKSETEKPALDPETGEPIEPIVECTDRQVEVCRDMEPPMWGARKNFPVAIFNGELWLTGSYFGERILWHSADGIKWQEFEREESFDLGPGCYDELHQLGQEMCVEHYYITRRIKPSQIFAYDGKLWMSECIDLDSIYAQKVVRDCTINEQGEIDLVEDASGGGMPSGFVHNGKLWSINYDQQTRLNSVYRRDPAGADRWQWVKVAEPAAWGGRIGYQALSFGGKIWLIGGTSFIGEEGNIEASPVGDVWYSVDGINWEKALTNPMGQRYGHAALTMEVNLPGGEKVEKMFITGGVATKNSENLNDVWYYVNYIKGYRP